MRYWAHLGAERLNGSEFNCVQAGIRRQSVRTGMAGGKIRPQAARHMAKSMHAWCRFASHDPVIYMATFSVQISPFFPDFRQFIVSRRGKLGLTRRSCLRNSRVPHRKIFIAQSM